MSKNIINRKRSSGFTMIELLAVIAILSIVSVIVIYTATNIVGSAKDKSYKVTINNIQNESNTYVIENDSYIVWLPSIDGISEYQCLSVQNLIDVGYFDNDILDSKVDEDRKVLKDDNIYIERNIDNKSIAKNILIYDDDYNVLCNQTNIDPYINIYVPGGWARSKEVIITYMLNKNISNVDKYQYTYSFNNECKDGDKDYCENDGEDFKLLKVNKNITVLDNGFVNASILDSLGFKIFNASSEVTGIDRISPNIEIETEHEIVRGSITIPIKIIDNHSGVDGNTISLSDFKVSIGGNVLDKLKLKLIKKNYDKIDNRYYNYDLIINDREYAGYVVIEVDSDVIFDNVLNGNLEKIFNTGIEFDNRYMINYNANSGIGDMMATECIYGRNCTLRDNIFTKTGYTYLGWSDNRNDKSIKYQDKYMFTPFNIENDLTLYAIWDANKYTINYNANGGSGDMSNTICKYDSSCKLEKNGFIKTGYTFNGWNTKSDGTGDKYVDESEVKNLSSKDGDIVILYAQWKANTYTINYNANGGSGDMSNTICKYDSSCKLEKNGFIKTGYTFNGWNTKSDGTGDKYVDESEVKNLSSKDGDIVILYAQWKANTYTINYNTNGGSGDMSNTICKYDSSCKLEKNGFIKRGYTFNSWNTKSDGTGDKYLNESEVKNLSSKDGDIVILYAQWKANKVYINFNTNGGSIVSSTTTDGGITRSWSTDNDGTIYANGNIFTQSVDYDQTVNLSNYNYSKGMKISLVGYVALDGHEWKCLSGCTNSNNSYDQEISTYVASDFCDASISNCTVELGVNWVDSQSPTCQINAFVGNTTITATCNDNSGTCTYYGWNSSYSGANSTSKIINETGTIRYYVKDAAGNTGNCSVSVVSTNISSYCPNGYTASGSQCTKCISSSLKADGTCGCAKYYDTVNKKQMPARQGTCNVNNKCDCVDKVEYNYCNAITVCNSYETINKVTSYSCSSEYIKLSNSFCLK